MCQACNSKRKLRKTETYSGRPYLLCVDCGMCFIKTAEGIVSGMCSVCKGTGYVEGGLIVRGDVVCPECKGIGRVFTITD